MKMEVKILNPGRLGKHNHKLTEFWWKRAKAKVLLEQSISKQLMDFISKTREEMKTLQESPEIYIDPNLVGSLELELSEDEERADIAKTNACAYRSLSAELEKAVDWPRMQLVEIEHAHFKRELHGYEKLLQTHVETEKNMQEMKKKYRKTVKKLNKLKKAVTNGLDTEKVQDVETKILKTEARRKIQQNKYEDRRIAINSFRLELTSRSMDVLAAWRDKEEKQLEFLFDNWKKCINLKREDSLLRDCQMMKAMKAVCVYSMLNKLEEKKLKPANFIDFEEIVLEPEGRDEHKTDSAFKPETLVTRVENSTLARKFEQPGDDGDAEKIKTSSITDLERKKRVKVLKEILGEDILNTRVEQKPENPEMVASDNSKKNVRVVVIKEYKKQKKSEISLHVGHKIKQLLPENEQGFAFGFKRNSLNQKRKGFYPANHVALC